MPDAPARLYTTAQIETQEPGRGRNAEGPLQIPRKGWIDIALRVWQQIGVDRVGLVAAGVAFYGLLAIFPAITAMMAIAGLLYQPAELVSALEGVSAIVPPDVSHILLDQAKSVAGGGAVRADAGARRRLPAGALVCLRRRRQPARRPQRRL